METQNLVNEYEHYSHSVGTLMLHLEWVTKYRYKMFRKEEQKNLVTACIRRAASLHEIKIIEIQVMPEHVHVAVQVALTLSPAKVLQILKGISARLFFMKNPKARLRLPKGNLWSKGKFAASLGFIQVGAAREYIKKQASTIKETADFSPQKMSFRDLIVFSVAYVIQEIESKTKILFKIFVPENFSYISFYAPEISCTHENNHIGKNNKIFNFKRFSN